MIIDLQPCYRFTGNSLIGQTRKMREETAEVREALFDNDLHSALIETWDVVQTAVTMLENFKQERYDIEAALEEMKAKNEARGYYDDNH